MNTAHQQPDSPHGGRRAVVIGAGLGGLAVALRLAHRGWRVTVCERHHTPGGKMNRWTHGGYTFDTGPSLITMPWVFDELWQAFGARREEDLECVQLQPHAEYRYPDGVRFAYSTSMPEWLPVVRELEGGDASGFFRFMALGARLYALSRATFFKEHPRFSRPDLASLRALRHMPWRQGFGNYHRVVESHFRSAHLRQLFDRYPTYVGSSPYRTPSTLSVIPYLEYAFGGWHVRGGLYRLIEVLLRHADRLGVEVRTGCGVTALERRAGRVRHAVLESGETLEAEVFVMNGDPSTAPVLLGEANAQPLPEQARSLSGLVLLLAVKGRLDGVQHHTVCFSADYPKEFRQLFDDRRFPDDPTVYVNVPSRTDASMAPADGESVFVMANAPAADMAWDDRTVGEARRRVMARLAASGFPALEGRVVAERAVTPADLAGQLAMPGGAIYGGVSHGWRGAFLRPANKDPKRPGLYYVGGGTHPGGGTPTVLLSAAITAGLVERYEGS